MNFVAINYTQRNFTLDLIGLEAIFISSVKSEIESSIRNFGGEVEFFDRR